jgi:pteridine reductase
MPIDRFEDSRPDLFPRRGFLAGRTALVTGGARRIGRELALSLAAAGAAVVVHYRESENEARETVAEIVDSGGEGFRVRGDLARAECAAGLAQEAAETAGRSLDILINNASVFAPGDALTTTVEQWDHNQAVNLRAPFLLAQSLARQLPQDVSGNIINLNDFRAVRPGADHFPYTISKVGLHGLTSSLALALAPRVRVNELALGAILPPEGASADYLHTLRSEIPTGKFDSPYEVSQAMLFLLGNRALTGQTLFIDGGRHLK